MATIAEQLPVDNIDFDEQRLVVAIPEMAEDEFTRARAARFIGAVALGCEGIEVAGPQVEKPIESLHHAIHEATAGDAAALRVVTINVGTDVVERTIKSGHVMNPVEMIITSEGKIVQHRQYMDSIQANSLRHAAGSPIMRARTEAETRNAFRLEHANREGLLDEYSFLVLSRADNIPATFFTDTMSCSIQLTSKIGDKLVMESAFVAGIAKPGAQQHDISTIVKLGKLFGVDLSDKTPAEIIDTPLLIHNSLLQNGVVDIVKLYDDCAGNMFFGEAKVRQDYLAYRQACTVRETSFQPTIDQIVADLLAEAPSITSPVMATQRLHKLSEEHMVRHALADSSIDARVFGPGATHLELARWHYEQGHLAQAAAELKTAVETAISVSCPTAGNTAEQESSKPADCEFTSKKCPVCGEKNAKTKVSNGMYTHVGKGCRAA